MINCIAIDDEPPALKVIETFCSQTEGLDLKKCFTSSDEAIHYLQHYPVDLVFLDIHMPNISGIELYKKITQPLMVIFVTAHSEYAVEGFNLNAIDYLLKPITLDRFNQAVKKAQDQYQFTLKQTPKEEQVIYIRADYMLNKIRLDEIKLIEGLDDYLKIQLQSGKNIVARLTMKNIQEKLPANRFKRVHRSFIVPLDKITAVRKKLIHLDQLQIPIGNSYEEDFYNTIADLKIPQ